MLKSFKRCGCELPKSVQKDSETSHILSQHETEKSKIYKYIDIDINFAPFQGNQSGGDSGRVD